MTLTDEQIYQLLDANYQVAVSDAEIPDMGGDLDALAATCATRSSRCRSTSATTSSRASSMLVVAQDWDEAARAVDSDWCGQVGKGYHRTASRALHGHRAAVQGGRNARRVLRPPRGAAAPSSTSAAHWTLTLPTSPRRRRRSSDEPVRPLLGYDRGRSQPAVVGRPERHRGDGVGDGLFQRRLQLVLRHGA